MNLKSKNSREGGDMMSKYDFENQRWKYDIRDYEQYRDWLSRPRISQSLRDYCVRRMREIRERYPQYIKEKEKYDD